MDETGEEVVPPELLWAGEVIARRVREVREHRGWSQQDLADALSALGYEQLSRGTIAKIELGQTRARNISVQDVFALGAALNCSPLHLFCPTAERTYLRITSKRSEMPGRVRQWVRGYWPLGEEDDPQDYFREIPRSEFDALREQAARRTPDPRLPEGSSASTPAPEHFIIGTVHPDDEERRKR